MLYIVPTPIGNLSDMTIRGIEVLKSVHAIACEDTRHSLKLLQHYEIRKPLIAFHKFNTAKVIDDLIEKLQNGQDIALISDAGMPCISDPGSELILFCIEKKLSYTVLPGATAFVNAVILSGKAGGAFTFLGFLPEKNSERKALLEDYRFSPCPLIFYISPHSIQEDIQDLYHTYGDRKISIVKELTKIYESVSFSTLKEGLLGEARGEYILIVDGCKKQNDLNGLSIERHLEYYLKLGVEKKQAIKQVAQDRGVHKNEVYKKGITK